MNICFLTYLSSFVHLRLLTVVERQKRLLMGGKAAEISRATDFLPAGERSTLLTDFVDEDIFGSDRELQVLSLPNTEALPWRTD